MNSAGVTVSSRVPENSGTERLCMGCNEWDVDGVSCTDVGTLRGAGVFGGGGGNSWCSDCGDGSVLLSEGKMNGS